MTAASPSFQDSPVASIKDSIRNSEWKKLDTGLLYLNARNDSYKIDFSAWKLSAKEFNIGVVEQKTAQGSAVSDHLVKDGDILALGGGFFKKDQEGRLSPAGMLVSAGVVRNGLSNTQSGAFVVDRRQNVDIVWARDLRPLVEYMHVVQSGPILVEDEGKMGIRSDDFDRLNRTAVCLTADHIVLIDVRGLQNKGLSLYQLASVLLEKPEYGGLGCRRALNLDGGPSTQVAFRDGGKVKYLAGLWKGQNALLVSRK